MARRRAVAAAPVVGSAEKEAEEPRLTPPTQVKEEEEEKVVEEPRLRSKEDKAAGPQPGRVEDYLMKYQVRKQTQAGSPASNPAEGTKAFKMKQFLLSQPKVRMFVPRPMNEDQSVMQSVNLNGYRLDFPKDAYIDVPEQVADVLMESLRQTNIALQINRIDGNSSKEAALL